jgi:hypothetical protein
MNLHLRFERAKFLVFNNTLPQSPLVSCLGKTPLMLHNCHLVFYHKLQASFNYRPENYSIYSFIFNKQLCNLL